jgi:hypothetical protein
MSVPPPKDGPKPTDAPPLERPVLSPGDLKERLPGIEAKTLELEKEAKKILALEEENQLLKDRLKNFERAVFSLLFHAVEPSDRRFAQRHLTVLAEGLELLNEKRV